MSSYIHTLTPKTDVCTIHLFKLGEGICRTICHPKCFFSAKNNRLPPRPYAMHRSSQDWLLNLISALLTGWVLSLHRTAAESMAHSCDLQHTTTAPIMLAPISKGDGDHAAPQEYFCNPPKATQDSSHGVKF